MLTKAQALKALHAIFAEYDKDESGYLDEAEMTELLHKLPIDGRVHMVKPFTPTDVKSVMKGLMRMEMAGRGEGAGPLGT